MTACPRCSARDLVAIDLSPRGRSVRFSTCRSCEHRWWLDAEELDVLPLVEVLSRMAAA